MQQLLLPLEFLQQLGLEVGARGDVRDLEQRDQRGLVLARLVAGGERGDARIEVLEPHERADALVQRMLVADHRAGAFIATVILTHPPADQGRASAAGAATAR